ncbi:autotransporter outer membrane beta-barrel domain-containing protein, partial [Methylobacterium sp. ARG-1]|uniref:autotransporter outer membrane beta-barrel domain-containing protein n=1 Tax=Methylobacterium sp. ARG-1 TaxID=1692501 RepID=UPI0006A51B82
QGTLLEHLRLGAGPGLTGAVGQRFASGTTLPAGYAALTPDEPVTGLVPVRPLAPRYGVWGQAFGVFGASEATRNTARLTRETGGFMLGVETGPGVLGDGLGSGLDGWRVGVAGGTSLTQFDVTARQSSGRIEGSFGAAYASGSLGPVQVRFGALYGRDALDTRRTVLFPGVSQAVSGRAGGSALQGVSEVGYRIGAVESYVEPYVGGAVLRLHRDGFTETGGASALAAFGRTDVVETATAGVQAQAVAADLFGGAGPLLARGLIGYRRAFGDGVPAALLAFRGGTA